MTGDAPTADTKAAKRPRVLTIALVVALVVASGFGAKNWWQGQHGIADHVNWQTRLPPPPIVGSPVDLADQAAVVQAQSLRGGPRWQQAVSDISFDMFAVYRPIIGESFTAQDRPKLKALLDYADRQLRVANRRAKLQFNRPRPFKAVPSLQLCTPELPRDSSYPSGHAAWGWLSAHIVATLEPDHANAILVRGREFGQSRVVCGVHYPSDVAAGRLLAEAMLVELDQDPEYQRLLVAAK